MHDDFQRRLHGMRNFLEGKEYWLALRAMALGSKHHTGVRKNGFTPEFDHQVSIAYYLRSLLPSLRHKEETLCVAFLHDVREDYGLADDEIRGPFGSLVADGVSRMTKTFRGVKADPSALFAEMARCPVASIVKAADRIHNFQSMVGVFTVEKQRAYIAECEELFIPMLKEARKNHPEQAGAYANAKYVLRQQIALIRAILEGLETRAA